MMSWSCRWECLIGGTMLKMGPFCVVVEVLEISYCDDGDGVVAPIATMVMRWWRRFFSCYFDLLFFHGDGASC